jgi:hypothetical protein
LREILLIGEARHISWLFPHVLNIYPVGKMPEPRKRSWGTYYARYFNRAIYFGFRLAALLLFVGPTVVPYVAGTYFQFNIDNNIYPMLLGALVGFIAFMLALLELLPVHFTKSFPHEILKT